MKIDRDRKTEKSGDTNEINQNLSHSIETEFSAKAPKNKSNGIVAKIALILGCTCLGSLAVMAIFNFVHLECGKPAPLSTEEKYAVSLNEAQMKYFSRNKRFAKSIDRLNINMKNWQADYHYSTRITEKAAFNYAIARQANKQSFVGAVFLVPAAKYDPKAAKDELSTVSILCVANSLGKTRPADPIINQKGIISCGNKTVERWF